MKIIIFGGTGVIGKQLCKTASSVYALNIQSYSKNYPISYPYTNLIPLEVLVRDPQQQDWIFNVSWNRLDLLKDEIKDDFLFGTDAVIHCVGIFFFFFFL